MVSPLLSVVLIHSCPLFPEIPSWPPDLVDSIGLFSSTCYYFSKEQSSLKHFFKLITWNLNHLPDAFVTSSMTLCLSNVCLCSLDVTFPKMRWPFTWCSSQLINIESWIWMCMQCFYSDEVSYLKFFKHLNKLRQIYLPLWYVTCFPSQSFSDLLMYTCCIVVIDAASWGLPMLH